MTLTLADMARRAELTLEGTRGDDLIVDVCSTVPTERRESSGQVVVVVGDDRNEGDASDLPEAVVWLSTRDVPRPDRPSLACPDGRTIEHVRAQVRALFFEDLAGEARLLMASGQVLTHAALSGGVAGVVTQLASRTDGWAVLLDTNGEVVTSAAAAKLHLTEARAVVFHRPVRRRHRDLGVYPITSGGSTSAYLVIAARSGHTGRVRELAQHAADLINLARHTHDHSHLERLGRNTVVDWLASGEMEEAERVLQEWELLSPSVQAFALSSRSRSVDLESLVTRWLDELGAAHVLSSSAAPYVGLLNPDLTEDFLSRVEEVVINSGVPLACGIGRPEPIGRIPQGVSQARSAHSVALATNSTSIRYDDMRSTHLLELTMSGGARRDLADVLRPLDLDGQDGLDALGTVSAYLAENANVARTASRLGVHRHTVRNRIERAEALCGLSFANADDRAIAWLAVRARMFK